MFAINAGSPAACDEWTDRNVGALRERKVQMSTIVRAAAVIFQYLLMAVQILPAALYGPRIGSW